MITKMSHLMRAEVLWNYSVFISLEIKKCRNFWKQICDDRVWPFHPGVSAENVSFNGCLFILSFHDFIKYYGLFHKLLSRLQTMASTSSESVEKELCKLVVTHKDGKELHTKLCVTTWVMSKSITFSRFWVLKKTGTGIPVERERESFYIHSLYKSPSHKHNKLNVVPSELPVGP